MKIDFNRGVSFQIGGEVGKYNTLPIKVLVDIAQNLEELIKRIAILNIDKEETIDTNHFKIELSNFKPGSAIPEFVFTKRIQVGLADISSQRDLVNKKIDEVLQVADSGDYLKLKELYTTPEQLNEITEGLYKFTTSFGTAPVKVVTFNGDPEPSEIYSIRQFKKGVKQKLLTKVELVVEEPIADYAVKYEINLSKKGKPKKKKVAEYRDDRVHLAQTMDSIHIGNKKYLLNIVLTNIVEMVDNFYVIRSELLDIIGTGYTQAEAEFSFCEEFDFIYESYNSLEDNQLTNRLKRIKDFLNMIVKKVETNEKDT
ncbi:MAG: hypothetical protein KAH26_11625 [Bacteroidales bacterium]|nr:hypothetical protein [Bacteroidales bacterium]